MTLTVVGSIAFDAVETPSGSRDRLLGGSAVHFAIASSQFAETRIVGPVGDDFGEGEYEILHGRGVVTDDGEHIAGGKTFFWSGRYHRANIQPDLQREVREQCTQSRFVAMDSMNFWIESAHGSLLQTISLADCLVLNDGELEQLTDEPNIARAARKALTLGPRVVIAKQGEYGSAMFTRDGGYFGITAYPTADIVEPTGAGDTFAGGLMGFLAAHPGEIDEPAIRRAMAYGTACASFNVEGFGSERLYELDRAAIDSRVADLETMTRF